LIAVRADRRGQVVPVVLNAPVCYRRVRVVGRGRTRRPRHTRRRRRMKQILTLLVLVLEIIKRLLELLQG
jgi:hypothetical protein